MVEHVSNHIYTRDVPAFLKFNSDGLHPGKLLETLNDSTKCRKLKMELAITIDGMKPFAKATGTYVGMVLESS